LLVPAFRSQAIRRLVTFGLVLTFIFLVRFNVLLPMGLVQPADERQSSVGNELQSCASEIVPPQRPMTHELRMRGLWQVYSTDADSADELVTYSTFYDDRPILRNKTYLRTLAISSFPAETTIFYCQVMLYRRQCFVLGRRVHRLSHSLSMLCNRMTLLTKIPSSNYGRRIATG